MWSLWYIKIYMKMKYFCKGYVPNWSEEGIVTKKFKNTVPWIYVISVLNKKEIARTFYKKYLQKTTQKGFRVEK